MKKLSFIIFKYLNKKLIKTFSPIFKMSAAAASDDLCPQKSTLLEASRTKNNDAIFKWSYRGSVAEILPMMVFLRSKLSEHLKYSAV
jgi:hypothetical protein